MAAYQYNLMAVEDAYVTKAQPAVNNHNVSAASLIAGAPGNLYGDPESRYYVRFGLLPAEYRRYRLITAALMLYITSKYVTAGNLGWLNISVGTGALDLGNVLFGDAYDALLAAAIDSGAMSLNAYNGEASASSAALNAITGISHVEAGVNAQAQSTFGIQGVAGANKPYLLLTFQDATNMIQQTPASGFLNEKAVNTLRWQLQTDAYGGAAAYSQASAVVSWRNGSGGTIYTINVSGSAAECIIPADTFPAGTAELQWKVDVTYDGGVVVSSGWATLTTIDSASSCSLISPVSAFVDGDAPSRFTWMHEIPTGSAQTAYDLQYSTDNGEHWTSFAAGVASAEQHADILAGTLPAGTLLWRARTYNTDNVAGDWSAVATIVVQAAPAAPSIMSASASPRPVIAWQAVGQQAYRVRAGEYDTGAVYGTAKTYKIPIYLPDGPMTIQVAVQNAFGLWSPWASVDITIAHTGVVAVQAVAAHDNSEITLTWTGAHEIYYIYRDGHLIAKTTERQYVDRLALGTHSYAVRGASGDAYDLSEAVTASAVCKTAMMADIDDIDWVYLRSRRGAKPATSASISQQVAYQHYAGRALPVADVAEYIDEAYSFDYSFLSTAEAAKARALLGKVVVLKTPRDECIIGVLESTPYERDRWSTDFAFTIRAVDRREAVTYDV